MIKKNLIKIVLTFFLGLLFGGCKGNTGPAGPIPSGNIAGKVRVYNPNGNDNSGVTVTLDGNSSYSTTTNLEGKWEIPNVQAGVYNVIFSKTGYFTVEDFNIQFVGNGTYYLWVTEMAPIPSATIAKFNVSIDSTNSVQFKVALSKAAETDYGIYFLILKSPSIDLPIEATDILGATIHKYLSKIDVKYYTSYINNITSSDTLYAIAYHCDARVTGINNNPRTGLYEFNTPGVTLSNMVSFVMP